jgi:hypothetical protein
MNGKRLVVAPLMGLAFMGAVGASAATITDTVPKLGAATSVVSTCDPTLTTGWDAVYDATLAQYKVSLVNITNLDGVACAGGTMKVTLANSVNAVLGTEKSAAIVAADTSKSLNFTADNIPAASVAKVNIVIIGP